ncbi:hypothetical protein L211DRAFT_833603 [Terfezia boudieri ATCC MYA-4762]|uniref:Uncharacterized protein n=1 Tax=Terfezia boudieri ATCC MYA-4762 TaxID=1051890 RepID=A0A3N4M7P9_9PEZI|nr:hypothetical protein L211DRAFT_833603 [Terfezia boudieri ATCC MYA-4762]
MSTTVSHAHARRSGPPPPAPATTATATVTGTPAARIHRKPFSSLMKRLAGLKSSHHHSSSAAHTGQTDSNSLYKRNLPSSGEIKSHSGKQHRSNSHPGIPTPLNTTSTINTITGPSYDDLKNHHQSPLTGSESSASSPSSAPKPSNHTVTTTATSLKSPSTFSSPAPSVRSLTTTLTTIQSTAPNFGNGAAHQNYNPHASHHHNPNSAPILFSNPLPSPSHLHPSTAPGNNQQYYSTATANSLLTDNASIITLASSSKRRRRHSFDTDASIRALAPASVWGGSRESLPLSVLSSLDNTDRGTTTGSIRIPGDRSSLYGRLGGDGASIKGVHSPGVNSPISGQGGGGGAEYFLQGRENYSVVGGPGGQGVGAATSGGHGCWGGMRSRRGSGWGEVHANEEVGPRRDGDEDDARSARSRRTASVASGKTGRTMEDERAHAHDLGECEVVDMGAKRIESPLQVALNKTPGKGKGKVKM